MSDNIKKAFHQICKDSVDAKNYYVSLMVEVPYYGGPEEGGWWGEDMRLVSYKRFNNLEAAKTAANAVEDLAKELNDTERRQFGDHCLRQMEWLDARGLDSEFLPEPDGESKYIVVVSEGIPEENYGPRRYE